ncbi:MAG: hypothetical protein HQL94_11500, partial [Magnetococcales bacterium]|nr:hypothetical protein [Magnetococcales bacterium]
TEVWLEKFSQTHKPVPQYASIKPVPEPVIPPIETVVEAKPDGVVAIPVVASPEKVEEVEPCLVDAIVEISVVEQPVVEKPLGGESAALVPVEPLGVGLLNVLGDVAEGVVVMGRKLAPQPNRIHAVPDFYDRMGGRAYHGAHSLFSGVGGIMVGGIGIALGTVGCLLGAAGTVRRSVGGGYMGRR